MRLKSATMIDVEKAAWEKGYNWFSRDTHQWWFTEWGPTGTYDRGLDWQEQHCIWSLWDTPLFNTLAV